MCPMIKKLYGNLFDSRMETLVNTVNCIGVMSKGIALQFKLRYPEMFHDYKAKCAAGSVLPGKPYLYRDTTEKSILNFPTRRHWRDDSRIVDIESGLDCFVVPQSYFITAARMPPQSCMTFAKMAGFLLGVISTWTCWRKSSGVPANRDA